MRFNAFMSSSGIDPDDKFVSEALKRAVGELPLTLMDWIEDIEPIKGCRRGLIGSYLIKK